jgi:hypothetical protein
MNSPTLLIAVLVSCGAAIAWLLVVRSQRPSSAGTGRAAAYHCVAIACPDRACDAAKNMRSNRFLSHEAPLLPLPKCTTTPCRCRYLHFSDRRVDLRRNPYGLRRSVPPEAIARDRRCVDDRRASMPSR